MSILFLWISIANETYGVSREFSRNTGLTLDLRVQSKEQNDINCLFTLFFLVPQKDEIFLRHHKKLKIKIYISIDYFRMLGTGRLIKFFSHRIFVSI